MKRHDLVVLGSNLAEHHEPNALPLDDAAVVPLGNGVTGRYGLCPTATLRPHPKNARTHSKNQIKKLADSIKATAHLAPVVIDEYYVVLAGHARVLACGLNREPDIPVIQVFGASEAMKRVYLIADNRIAEDAGWDREKFALELPELKVLLEEANIDLTATGFEIAELDQFEVDFEALNADPADEIAEAEAEPVLRLGDLIQLGNHRVIVGDCRDEPALDRLCEGRRVAAGFLDPPYNVSSATIGGRGRVQHKDFAFASGEMSRAEFVTFLKQATGNAARVSEPSALHFVCMDWKHIRDLIEAGEAVYNDLLNIVVWNKTNAGQGGLYRSQHELISVFRVGAEPHLDNVQMGRFGRNRSNVWTYPGVNTFRSGRMEDLEAHPTVKPVKLVADALRDCTRRGDAVLDTFSGSGTLILACERVGRHALAMDIEPKYVEIAIRRWQTFTGRDAIDLETGLTFDELVRMRRTPPPRKRTR